MIVGFTGTSGVVTPAQQKALEGLLFHLDSEQLIDSAHHGDCRGADAVFDRWCADCDIERHAHPGHDKHGLTPYAANCATEVRYPAKWYIDRNHDIVDRCEVLVACPAGPEQKRSGTWATVRYARSVNRRVVIVWPDGTVE